MLDTYMYAVKSNQVKINVEKLQNILSSSMLLFYYLYFAIISL